MELRKYTSRYPQLYTVFYNHYSVAIYDNSYQKINAATYNIQEHYSNATGLAAFCDLV